MKVSPVLNEYGKVAKNQYSFVRNGCRYLQSYNDIVAKIDQNNGAIQLDKKHYNNSTTTLKYIKLFLNLSGTKIHRLINDGTIEMVDLNK